MRLSEIKKKDSDGYNMLRRIQRRAKAKKVPARSIRATMRKAARKMGL